MWSEKKGCEENAGFLVSVEIDPLTDFEVETRGFPVKSTPITSINAD